MKGIVTTKKASPDEVRLFMRKFYRFLKEGHEIKFRKIGHSHGYIYTGIFPTSVVFDHRAQLFPTIIHEAIHYIYPDLTEDQVLRKEALIVNALSNRQVKNVLKRFAEAL